MKKGSGTTTSVWMGSAELPSRTALGKDITTDVCVVGAGIAGLTTAYLLSEKGQAVVVLDDGPIGGGELCFGCVRLQPPGNLLSPFLPGDNQDR